MITISKMVRSFYVEGLHSTNVGERVSWLTSATPRSISLSNRNFSLFRFLGLASLLISVRGQLFPAQLQLSDLQGIDGITFLGDQSQDNSGTGVAGIGDINADGVDDFAIGAFKASPSPDRMKAGRTYIIFGRRGLALDVEFELSSLNGTNGFIIDGEHANDESGSTVTHAGDINNDGISDLLIGAPGAAPDELRNEAGRVYVIFGHTELGIEGRFDLRRLNGVNGFILNGEGVNDRLSAVAGAGDINGDGIGDILVGAIFADPLPEKLNAGKTYLILGKSGLGAEGIIELNSPIVSLTLNGENAGDLSGHVSIAEDVNADGFDDILTGAYSAGEEQSGKVYLVFGRETFPDSIDLASLRLPSGLVFTGERRFDAFGATVSGAGDVNDDGIADLLIGASGAGASGQRMNSGKTYVIFGQADIRVLEAIRLSTLNGTTGFIIEGEEAGDGLGIPVAAAGDVNGDGIADILVGAHRADIASVGVDAGKTYLVFGRPNLGSIGTLDLSKLNGSNGVTILGEEEGDTSGRFIASAGDVNGDGIDDILTSAIFANVFTDRVAAGKTYLVFGRRSNPPSTVPMYTSSGSESSITQKMPNSSSDTLSTTSRRFKTSQFAASSSIDVTPAAIGGGIAAGIVALVGCGAAILWSKRRGEEKASGADQSVGLKPVATERDSINPPLPSHYQQIVRHEGGGRYTEPVLHPPGSHYLGGEELEVFNREHVEYLSAKVQDDGYDDIPQF